MVFSRRLKGITLELVDRCWPVRPQMRTQDERAQLDRESRRMHLYYTRGCPASISVKRHCEKLGLRVVIKDVQHLSSYRNELIFGGGQPKVPCLRVDDDQGSQWLYSPETIRAYLDSRF